MFIQNYAIFSVCTKKFESLSPDDGFNGCDWRSAHNVFGALDMVPHL